MREVSKGSLGWWTCGWLSACQGTFSRCSRERPCSRRAQPTSESSHHLRAPPHTLAPSQAHREGLKGDAPVLVAVDEPWGGASCVGAGADDEEDDEQERLEVEQRRLRAHGSRVSCGLARGRRGRTMSRSVCRGGYLSEVARGSRGRRRAGSSLSHDSHLAPPLAPLCSCASLSSSFAHGGELPNTVPTCSGGRTTRPRTRQLQGASTLLCAIWAPAQADTSKHKQLAGPSPARDGSTSPLRRPLLEGLLAR